MVDLSKTWKNRSFSCVFSMFLWVGDFVRIQTNHTEHFNFWDDFSMFSMRILRSGKVFWRPGGLLKEVWGVWKAILVPIG